MSDDQLNFTTMPSSEIDRGIFLSGDATMGREAPVSVSVATFGEGFASYDLLTTLARTALVLRRPGPAVGVRGEVVSDSPARSSGRPVSEDAEFERVSAAARAMIRASRKHGSSADCSCSGPRTKRCCGTPILLVTPCCCSCGAEVYDDEGGGAPEPGGGVASTGIGSAPGSPFSDIFALPSASSGGPQQQPYGPVYLAPAASVPRLTYSGPTTPPMIFRPLTDEENKLFDDVIKKVEEREKLEDSYKDHRTGGTNAIKGAVKEIKKDIDGIKAGTTDPERIKALLWGLGQYLDPKTQAEYARASKSPQKPGSVSGYAGATPAKGAKPATEGDWKCNKFVADSYATGAGVGLSTGDDWGGKNNVTGKGFPASKGDTGTWGPQANDLAKEGENLRSLTGAKEADVAGTGGDPP